MENGGGEASETGHRKGVGMRSQSGFDFGDEEDIAVGEDFSLGASHLDGFRMIREQGTASDFMVMRGKEDMCAVAFYEMISDGGGKGESFCSRGAPSDFINEDEGARRGGVEDVCSFTHFQHESRLVPGKVVGCTDPGENGVYWSERTSPSGYE